MPEENQENQENQQNNQSPIPVDGVKNNGDLFGFLERMLTPIVSVGQKSENKTPDADETIAKLQAEIEELKSSIETSKSSESSESKTPAQTEDETSESSESSQQNEAEKELVTPAFPQPRGEGGDFKSYREKYEELVLKSPRKAAKYFQENGVKILEGVRFFGE